MIVSASQLKTYKLCPRKWWYEKVLRLPRLESSSLRLGTAFHGVMERFLRADQVGRVQGKVRVDLYPKGWDAGLTKQQSERVRLLAGIAFKEGIVKRVPSRRIEHKFTVAFSKRTLLTGMIDVLLKSGIEDHKTTSNWRYALSEKKLRDDLQILLYAGVWFSMNPDRKNCLVAHNAFNTRDDPGGKKPLGRKTSVLVSEQHAMENWKENQARAEEMYDLKDIWKEVHWSYVKGPSDKDPQKACNAYGGCAFLKICGGVENPAQYKVRIKRIIEQQAKGNGASMGLFSKRIANKAKAPAPKAPKPAPTPKATPPKAPTPAPACEECGEALQDDGTCQYVHDLPDPAPQEAGETPAPEPEGSAEDTSKKRKRGRPKGSGTRTFTLTVGCHREGAAGNRTDTIFEVFKKVIKVLDEAAAPDSFWETNAFVRRDGMRLALANPDMIPIAKGSFVYSPRMSELSPDIRVLLEILLENANDAFISD